MGHFYFQSCIQTFVTCPCFGIWVVNLHVLWHETISLGYHKCLHAHKPHPSIHVGKLHPQFRTLKIGKKIDQDC